MRRTDSAIAILKRDMEAGQRREDALRREIERLRCLTAVGLTIVISEMPAFENLIHVATDMIHAADPLRSKELDGDKVHVSGGSPDEGAATRQARQRLIRTNKKIERLAEQIEQEMSGDSRQRVDKPRCRSRQCPQPNRRQEFGVRFCGFCGRDMGEEVGDE